METTFDYNVVIATGISVVLVEYLSSLYFSIRRRNATKTYKAKEKAASAEKERVDKESDTEEKDIRSAQALQEKL
jgi:hypothetical protein